MHKKKLVKRIIGSPYFNCVMIVFGFLLFVVSQHVQESWLQSLERGRDFFNNILPVSFLSWSLLLASVFFSLIVALKISLQRRWFRHFMDVFGVISFALIFWVILFYYFLAS